MTKFDSFLGNIELQQSKSTSRAPIFTGENLQRWGEVVLDLLALCQKTPKEYQDASRAPNMVQRIRMRRVISTHFPGETRAMQNQRINSLCLACSDMDLKDLTDIQEELSNE